MKMVKFWCYLYGEWILFLTNIHIYLNVIEGIYTCILHIFNRNLRNFELGFPLIDDFDLAFCRAISENEREIEALFARYSIIEVRAVTSRSSSYGISIAEAALIVIAVVIFVGALVGIIILLWSRHK